MHASCMQQATVLAIGCHLYRSKTLLARKYKVPVLDMVGGVFGELLHFMGDMYSQGCLQAAFDMPETGLIDLEKTKRYKCSNIMLASV